MIDKWPKLSLEKVTIPPWAGASWCVSRFKVSERDARFHNLRCMINASRTVSDTRIRPGTYTGLYRLPKRGPDDGNPIMSDTPAEMADHAGFVRRAEGRILMTGLGIGLCIHNLLLKKTVGHITVIERDTELCELIGPHYTGDSRVRLICADAFTWKPDRGDRFDYAWHDIWPSICSDNIPEIKTLTKRFRRACGSQDAWAYFDCLRASRV